MESLGNTDRVATAEGSVGQMDSISKLRVLFLGLWATITAVQSVSQAWVKRLASDLDLVAECVVLDPPFFRKNLWTRRAIGFDP